MPEPLQRKGANPAEVAWRGIELCRDGDWKEGMYWLGMAAGIRGRSEMPSQFFSYLGYGIARYQGQKSQGLKLCRHALDLEFYQPENYLYLARTHLLLGDRRSAVDAVERGLEIDAGNDELLTLRDDLGTRRPPVLPFLSRRNPLNQLLGRMRHRLRRTPQPVGEPPKKQRRPKTARRRSPRGSRATH